MVFLSENRKRARKSFQLPEFQRRSVFQKALFSANADAVSEADSRCLPRVAKKERFQSAESAQQRSCALLRSAILSVFARCARFCFRSCGLGVRGMGNSDSFAFPTCPSARLSSSSRVFIQRKLGSPFQGKVFDPARDNLRMEAVYLLNAFSHSLSLHLRFLKLTLTLLVWRKCEALTFASFVSL